MRGLSGLLAKKISQSKRFGMRWIVPSKARSMPIWAEV